MPVSALWGRLMEQKIEQATRDRAILVVRLATFGGVISALGLSWVFADMAEAYFSGKPPQPTQTVPPTVPVAAAPVQKPPAVIQRVVHHPYGGPVAPAPSGPGPRPPSTGPAPAPPSAPPVCHSTPSKKC
jgi:hypothetical protein